MHSNRFLAAAVTVALPIFLGTPLRAQTPPILNLPSGTLEGTTSPGVVLSQPVNTQQATQYGATFSGLPGGLSVSNQAYAAWCVDFFGNFLNDNSFTPVKVFSTYDTAHLPANGQSLYWDRINWMLNNPPSGNQSTWVEQQAMWRVLSGNYAPPGYPLPQPDTDNYYNLAMSAGAGFVPVPGQVVGVILYVDGIYNYPNGQNGFPGNGTPNNYQDLMIAVPVPPGAIGDFVWQDTNQNGIQDAGEPGINGVTLKLCTDAGCGAVLATTTTTTFKGNNGYYQFTGLPLGNYYVAIDTSQAALTGLVPTITGQGTPATDSNPNPSLVTLSSGTPVDETIDFGFTPPGSSAIGDFVWQDNNANGLQDAGEPGLPGLTVKLCSDAACNTVLATTTTDQNGAYHFTGLFGGIYYVQVVPGAGFVATQSQVSFPANQATDSGGNVGGIPNEVNLPVNTTDNTIDFGFIPPAQGAIGDFVWHDLNRNGIQDSGEPGINNVTVRLFDSSNNLVATTTTITYNGQDGYYQFTGLKAGTYSVVVDNTTLPSGYTPTQSNAPGSTTANDSNGSPATVTLATNVSVDETIDFGYLSPCAGVIGDFVWNDLNHNGIQDAGEPGIPGVTVNLYDSNHIFIFSTTTDSNGNYQFTGRCAATYTVEVVTPPNFVPTIANAPGSTPANDSNGSPASVTLGIDQTDLTIDFGYYQPLGSISGVTYTDVNTNSMYDSGLDTTIPSVTVTLTGTDINGNPVNQTANTGANGAYSFTNLLASNAAGYTITVPTTAIGEKLETANPLNVVLAAGANSTNNNFGYVLGSISGIVYTDNNTNSTFDAGDTALVGVPVTLTGTDVNGNPVSLNTTSGAGGSYSFTGLPQSNAAGYSISVPATASGEKLETTSPLNVVLPAGGTSANNNFGYILGSISGVTYTDVNTNSVYDAGTDTTLAGVTVTLSGTDANGNPVSKTTTSGPNGAYSFTGLVASNPAGYSISVPSSASGEKLETTSPLNVVLAVGANSTNNNFGYVLGSISGITYTDVNTNGVYDAGTDTVLSGVAVTLTGTDVNGNPVSKTTTSAPDGTYSFTGLLASNAAGYSIAVTATASGEKLETASPLNVVLAAGATSANNNFGYVLGSISGITYTDVNTNSTYDAGTDTTLNGMTVTLTGTDANGNPVSKTTTSGPNGAYSFTNLVASNAAGYSIAVTATASGEKLETASPLNVVLAAGATSANNNFGYVLGSISGITYTDVNTNSTYDAGTDTTLNGVTVTLTGTDANGNAVSKTTTSGPNGAYSFTNLVASNGAGYSIAVTATASGEKLETASPLNVVLAAGATSANNNFGYVLGSISGITYTDVNTNSTYDAGTDTTLNGVTVTLTGTDANGNPVSKTTTSGPNGAYSFTNLVASNAAGYSIAVTATASGEKLETASPLNVVLAAGATSANNNFGYVLGSISGITYTDVNTNSTYDAGTDTTLNGVTVTLTGTDANGNAVSKTTTSGPNGAYSFTNLVASNAAGYSIAVTPTASGEKLETASPLNVVLAAGATSANNNFGYVLGSISGTVYSDNNKNSVLDSGDTGIGGVTVTLTDCSNNPVATTVTASNGTYSFNNLAAGCYKVSSPATANGENLETTSPLTVNLAAGQTAANNNFGYVVGSISGTVYSDNNKNSVLDSGDTGIGGVTVTLTDCSNNPIATTVTASNGTYSFNNLAAGCYKVSSPATANGENLETTSPLTVNLAAGQTAANNNFGYVVGSISGTVYSDNNNNSVLDSGDTGIPGVTVTLTDCSNNLLATTTSGANGAYSFNNLVAGCYKVSSPASANGENLETSSPLTVNLPAGGTSANNNFGYIYPPLVLYCPTVNAGIAGQPFNSPAMNVTGGKGPYTFSIATGSLPNGLTLNPNTGAITGTPQSAGSFSIKVTDARGVVAPTTCPFIINPAPQVAVTKTADASPISAGSSAGFTVTISNPGSTADTAVTLSDPLPAGAGNDVNWKIDTTTGNASCFTITGSVGNQMLTLNSSCNTLGSGASLSVHITGVTTAADAGTASVNPALNVSGVSGYMVLYEGTGGHNLSISNVVIGGNIGVGGTGHVQFSGPGTINGRLDFAAANTGQFANTNGSNVGPTSVNYNVSGVTAALTAINSLSSSLGALAGTPTSINGTMTINESSGILQTVNGVTYRVFNVTSYSESDGKLLTINGDGSGDPVVFNFAYNSNVNLAGDVALAGGLGPDQVIWNFATTGKNINLTNNASSYPYPLAFQGVILAPNDAISMDNSSLIGRVYGGDSSDMQIVSGDNLHMPPSSATLPNTATVTAANAGSVNATAIITVNPATNAPPTGGPVAKGDAATIGFWHNKNGQALIDAANGGPNSTALGNWLATQFPYLYGPQSPNDMTNAPNTTVAALFMTFFNVSGQKTQAQIMGGALAAYFTSSTLSGTVAVQYGFNSSSAGTGAKTFNVGGNGTAIGLQNNAWYTVTQLLQQANLDTQNGTFNANAFNSIFDGINQTGDIN